MVEACLCEVNTRDCASGGLVNYAGVRSIEDNLVPACIELRSRDEGSGDIGTEEDIGDHTLPNSVPHVEKEGHIAYSCGEEHLIVPDTNDDRRLEMLQ